jgi:hypothetical protein
LRKFQFRLDSALRWRQSRTAQRELELQATVQLRLHLMRDRDLLFRERQDAVDEVQTAAVLTGADLLALRHFIEVSLIQENRLQVRIQDADLRCQEARRQLQEARRDEKMLDVLKKKALAEWRQDYLKDMEMVAGETFLVNWARTQPRT